MSKLEQDQFIKDHYLTLTQSEMAKKIQMSVSWVQKRCKELDLCIPDKLKKERIKRLDNQSPVIHSNLHKTIKKSKMVKTLPSGRMIIICYHPYTAIFIKDGEDIERKKEKYLRHINKPV
jgi:hypothetical protein